MLSDYLPVLSDVVSVDIFNMGVVYRVDENELMDLLAILYAMTFRSLEETTERLTPGFRFSIKINTLEEEVSLTFLDREISIYSPNRDKYVIFSGLSQERSRLIEMVRTNYTHIGQ
jgi:hypothetical protein